jgi:hypothetical protein
LAALDAVEEPDGTRSYGVRHLHRWPLGTSFTGIASDLNALLTRPPQPKPPHDAPLLAGCVLAVDGTGVGQPVLEFFRRAGLPADLRGVFVTAGNLDTRDDAGYYHVPKKSLMGTLELLLESRRLDIARGIPLATGLAKELSSFGTKGKAARRETFECWRECEQDDLVLAVALAAWIAERTPPRVQEMPFVIGNRSTMPQGSTAWEHPPQVTGMGYMPLRQEGPGYGPYQSSTHSQTCPWMSSSPQALAGKLPTGVVCSRRRGL